MLLIQQSISFRAWTSRALMVYFRRALLLLVVRPRQHIINHQYLVQQQQNVYFSDAEDDEEILIVDDKRRIVDDKRRVVDLGLDRNETSSNRIQISQSRRQLLNEYVFKKLSQGLNNSMNKSMMKNQSSRIFDFAPTPETEQFERSIFNANQGSNSLSIKTLNTKINENKVLDDSIYSYQTHLPYNQMDILPRNPVLSSPSCPSCRPLSPIHNSLADKTSSSKSLTDYSSTSIQSNLSQSSDDENDIYEQYQNSFSHILHQTKSLDVIRQDDKLHSMLALEPNTSIITVRQLTYPPSNPNKTNCSMLTSHIRVRLIANRIDSSIQCDTKPIGCKKPSLCKIDKATSILIDMPYKTLYID